MSGSELRRASWPDIPSETVTELISRKLFSGKRIMLAQMKLAEGAVVPTHEHENEQITWIIEGALRFWMGAEGAPDTKEIVLSAGDVLHVPSGVPHKAMALEDTVACDVFSPPRQDWIDGSDTYFHDQ